MLRTNWSLAATTRHGAAFAATTPIAEEMVTVSPALSASAVHIMAEMAFLSRDEQQRRTVLRLALAQGLTNREIGERLFPSPRTIGSHLYRTFPRLGVTARSQLRDLVDPTGARPIG